MPDNTLQYALAPFRGKEPKTRYHVMRAEILTPIDLIRGYAALLQSGAVKLETHKEALQAHIAVIELSATLIRDSIESRVFETEKDVLGFWNANRQHVYDIIVAADQLAALKNQAASPFTKTTEWLDSVIKTAHQLAAVVEILTKPDLPLS
jgi:hypothetical protein